MKVKRLVLAEVETGGEGDPDVIATTVLDNFMRTSHTFRDWGIDFSPANVPEIVRHAVEFGFGVDLPPNVRASLDRYSAEGVPTGGFLRAVLENNLKEAFARADSINIRAMAEIVAHVYNNLPSASWGTAEKVDAWIAHHGLTGYAAALKLKREGEEADDAR